MYIFTVLFAVAIQFVQPQSVYNNITVSGYYVTVDESDMINAYIVDNKIQNSTNLLKDLPEDADLKDIIVIDQDLPILFNDSVKELKADIVKINRCGLVDIEPNAISNNNLTKLDLSENKLGVVKKHYFSENYIEIVDLSHNRIKKIEKGAFQDVGKSDMKDSWYIDKSVSFLRSKPLIVPGEPEINLDFNQMEVIEEGVFNNLKVRNLFISSNQIKILKPGSFAKMNTVRVLSLENNKIEEITKNVFEGKEMRHLSLRNNRIKHIDEESFSNLSKIEVIDLGLNKLEKLEKGVFNGLPLEKLQLDSNEINNIEEGAFEGLSNLKELKLSSNKLKEISTGVFVNLKLMFLYLNDNGIETVHPAAFTNLENLSILFLRNNRLVTVTEDMFNNLPRLEYIDLAGNQVSQVEKALHEKLQALQMVVLNETEQYLEAVKTKYIQDRYFSSIHVAY